MKVHEAMKLHDPDEGEYDASDDVIGHALGLVDTTMPAGLASFSISAEQAQLKAEIARLRTRLDMLLDDGMEPRGTAQLRPPGDLGRRTLERIRDREAVSLEFREPMQYKPRWRPADLAVAAAVFIAAFVGSLPVLKNGKAMAANLGCSTNLFQIWRALEQYSTAYNSYPNATAQNSRLPLGATYSLLLHTGHLDHSAHVTCPGCSSRIRAGELPHWKQLENQPDATIDGISVMMAEIYALHPGLRGHGGLRHLERAMIESMRAVIPLAGDAPPQSNRGVGSGNSPSHGGYGQNVIFADGHATFFRSRTIRQLDRDVYSSRLGNGSVAADPYDSILVPAAHCPKPD